LRGLCDPEAVDLLAKATQSRLVESHGGREAVLAQGGFVATPAPLAASSAEL
jgi:choline-sulfatase